MITWVESQLKRISAEYAPAAGYLAVIRLAFGIWVVVFPVDLAWVSRVPGEFFHPRPGWFLFMTGVPAEPWLVALMVLKVALGILIALGLWTVPASIGLSAAFIVGSGVVYSFSKVDHFILFELTPAFLACAGWGSLWSLDAAIRRRRQREVAPVHGMPVLLFALTIGWAMLSAAVPKILGGWLDPARFATRGYIARDIALDEKLGPLGEWILQIDSGLFWKLVDYATLIAEAGLIFVVFFPLLYRCWILLLIGFRLGAWVRIGVVNAPV